jgi:hypothetical protein
MCFNFGLGYNLGYFFTNSSDHPDNNVTKLSVLNKQKLIFLPKLIIPSFLADVSRITTNKS